MNNANAQPVENKQGVSTQGQSANNVVKPAVSTNTAPQQVQTKPTIQQPTQQLAQKTQEVKQDSKSNTQQAVVEQKQQVQQPIQKPVVQNQAQQSSQPTGAKPQVEVKQEEVKKAKVEVKEEVEEEDEEEDEDGQPKKKKEVIPATNPEEEALLSDLEAINDDFAAEIQAKKEKELAEARKKEGIKEEKEEELDLKPLQADEKLTDIMNLSADNIGDFLEQNGKTLDVAEEKKEEELKEETENDNVALTNLFENFELHADLWDELKFQSEMLDKIKVRVKLEIKQFIREELIPLLNSLIK